MEVTYNTRFLLRRGTAEAWEHNNPVLAYGEPGFDVTNYGLKIGDGKKTWKELDYLSATQEDIEKVVKEYLTQNPVEFEGGGFVALDTPPENKKLLWIDLNDNSSDIGGGGYVDIESITDAEIDEICNSAIYAASEVEL